MKNSLDIHCSYQYINPIHKFVFMLGDYHEVDYFIEHIEQIHTSIGWYNQNIQHLLLETSTGHLPLRHLFESIERFGLKFPLHQMPTLKWAIVQPAEFHLHHVATLYMEQSAYATQVYFFTPQEVEHAYQWLVVSK